MKTKKHSVSHFLKYNRHSHGKEIVNNTEPVYISLEAKKKPAAMVEAKEIWRRKTRGKKTKKGWVQIKRRRNEIIVEIGYPVLISEEPLD